MIKRKHNWQLLIFPVVILLLRLAFYGNISNYFMTWWMDPVYAYLFNGLNLAQGSWEIGHYDHPGTTVQVFAAVIIRCVYVFRNNTSLVEDVLTNPELYIGTATVTLILLHSVLVFVTGRLVYNRTQHVFLALFFQLTFLVSCHVIGYSNNLMPETFLVLSGNLFVLALFSYITLPQPNRFQEISSIDLPDSNRKYVWIFSLLTGFSIATKFSSFSVLLIPFLLLESAKRKVGYLILSCVFALVFMFPAISKIGAMWEWLVGLFIHSGRYGTGEPTIINLKEYINNLHAIFCGEVTYTATYLLAFAVIIFCLVSPSHKERLGNREFKLLLGIFLSMTAQIILVSKHFAEHYLIPVHVFIGLGIYLAGIFFKKTVKNSLIQRQLPVWSKYLLLCIFSVFLINRMVNRMEAGIDYYPGGSNPRVQTASFLSSFSQTPHVIAYSYFTAYPEPSLYFGTFYTGEKMQPFYKEELKKRYPNTYFYEIGQDNIHDWVSSISLQDIISIHKNILIYYADSNLLRNNSLQNELRFLTDYYPELHLKKIFYNNISTESVYRLSMDTSFKIISDKQEVLCNMDSLSADKKIFLSSDSNYFFPELGLQSQEQYYSGKNSIKLIKEHPYTIGMDFKVKEGELYEISAWRYSPVDKRGVIVAAAQNTAVFYKTSTYPNNHIFLAADYELNKIKDGWEQVSLNFYVNKNLNDSLLKFYLWNNGTEDVFFDDLRIKKISYLKTSDEVNR